MNHSTATTGCSELYCSSHAFTETLQALFKSSNSTPLYHVESAQLLPWISDLHLSLFATFAVYWLTSFIFETIDWSGLAMFERHRIHEPEEVTKRNKVTKLQVVRMVLLQQAIQTVLGLVCLPDEHERLTMQGARESMVRYCQVISWVIGQRTTLRVLSVAGKEGVEWLYWWGVPIAQFLLATFVLDTWQYFLHRAFHTNKWLYKNFHSWHHRLYVPYSFGALYNHPIEGLVLDSLGTVIASLCAGFSTRQDLVFFTVSTAKTIDDHCGFKLPFDPFQLLFPNNADYHDIHHQQFGIKKNFSQPYFTHWDVLLGTRMKREDAPRRRHTDQRDPYVKTGEAVPSLPNLEKDK